MLTKAAAVTVCATSLVASEGVAALPEPIVVHDFADAGVTLMPATAPPFDERLAALVPRWADVAAASKPYLVILSNRSRHTIVAYCVKFETTDASGRTLQHLVHFNYPGAVAGTGAAQGGLPRGREVRPGEERVVGTNYEIMPDVDNRWLTDYARQQREHLGDTRKIVVSIDAAIFDDGRLIGEDVSELQRAFEMYLDTTQGIYRSVVSRLDDGKSVDEVFQWLRTTFTEATEKGPGDRSAFYYVQAAGDVARARRAIGDDRVREVLAKAIRPAPFVITRERSR